MSQTGSFTLLRSRHFTFTTPRCTFDLLHFHRPLYLHMRVSVSHSEAAESTAEGRTTGRDPGRREQKKTTWHIPHIHFTPVKCDSCEARCLPPQPPPPMQPRANATSAAIITYSPAADQGKRVGLVRIPHPGTSFDTGHLPACLPTSFCI